MTRAMADDLRLAADFQPATEADWRALVDKTLGEKPFESLTDMGERLTTKVTGARHLVTKTHPAEAGGMIGHLYEANALEGLAHRS